MPNIRQRVTLPAKPHDVFEAFMDSKKHSKFTGGPAKISRAVGGKFSVFGGYATGETRELVKDKKIVQTWRAEDFPAKHVSKITLTLKRVPGGTLVSFFHSNVPAKTVKGITQGWKTYYWEPMKKMFGA